MKLMRRKIDLKKNSDISFFEFVYIWFKLQGLRVPKHQKRIALWLAALKSAENQRRGLLMAFRNSGKSTLVGLFCAWILFRNPSERILVMAADYALAKKMVRNVKRIIEQHPLTYGLKPSRLDQWAADQFTVNRVIELRDPSMLAKGLGANITGLRADVIICDDVEVPKNCDSSIKREELRNRLDELDYILTPQGLQLYIGTPHTYYTIYQVSETETSKECKPYLLGFRTLKLPLLDKNGHSVWPERFSDNEVASIRIRSGENKFLSQMMLEPVNITESVLNPDLLRPYRQEIEMQSLNGRGVLKIGSVRMLSASCWWDPSFASAKGDSSVVACVFTSEDGTCWLHDVEYIKISEADDDNQAALQCRKVIAFLRRNYLPSVRVESNGIGKFLPSILRQELKREGLHLAVIEAVSHENKQQRILEAFEVLLAARALYVHEKIWNTPFISEMREWSYSGSVHDDALDAVAGCLLSEPIRLPQTITSAQMTLAPSWSGSSMAYRAQTKFEI